jgi:hypothetical protein
MYFLKCCKDWSPINKINFLPLHKIQPVFVVPVCTLYVRISLTWIYLQEAIKEEKKVEEVKPKKTSFAGKRTMKHKN